MAPGFRLPDGPLADLAADVTVTGTNLLAKAFRNYEQYRFRLAGDDCAQPPQSRDIIRAGGVAAVLPVDLARREIILMHQFRLAAHVANGKGDLVEIVAGRVEAGEQPIECARRETVEEIGVAPGALIELMTYLSSPGLSDEQITLFLATIDAALVPDRGGPATEREVTRPMRVPIDAAVAALASGAMHNGPLIVALQWLALNQGRLDDVVRAGTAEG
jgi:ADP-ribose pyrophosphatase